MRDTEVAGAEEVTPRAMKPRKKLPSERGDPQQRQVDRSVDPVSTLRILEYFGNNIAPAYKLSRSTQGWQLLLSHLRGEHADATTRQQWNLLPTHVGDTILGPSLNIEFLHRENVDVHVCDFSADKAQSSIEHMRDFERSKISYSPSQRQASKTNFSSLPTETR